MSLDAPHSRDTPVSSLVILLKAPQRSKRRLAARIGEAGAAAAAFHLLACALEDASDWPGHVVLAPAEATDAAWLANSGPGPHDVVVQQGRTLGERISHIDAVLRSRGLERLIYIGADTCLAKAAQDVARKLLMFVAYRQHTRLHRREPEREGASLVFNQDTKETFQ